MSNSLFGNQKTVSNLCEPLGHSFPTEQTVSVDVPSLSNRKTTTDTLNKYLKSRDGFDERCWDKPTIAELPDGSQYLFDGDHSRHLWKLAFPEEKTMPARIIQVSSIEEISELFVHRNETGKKKLSAEEIFVHEHKAGIQSALQIGKLLQSAKLQVSLGTGEAGCYVGASSSVPTVKIMGLKKAINESSHDAVVLSSYYIQRAFPYDKEMKTELLQGISIAINGLQTSTIHRRYLDQIPDFLDLYQKAGKKQSDISSDFKAKGGKIGNQDSNCVALGFLKEFRQFFLKSHSSKTWNSNFGPRVKQIQTMIELSKI